MSRLPPGIPTSVEPAARQPLGDPVSVQVSPELGKHPISSRIRLGDRPGACGFCRGRVRRRGKNGPTVRPPRMRLDGLVNLGAGRSAVDANRHGLGHDRTADVDTGAAAHGRVKYIVNPWVVLSVVSGLPYWSSMPPPVMRAELLDTVEFVNVSVPTL